MSAPKSADAPDQALERLNYFNGQRLAAGDLRAEQGYHMGVRRVLNRSLYSPGIVKGLEVVKHKTDKHKVQVQAGLAFDHLGREILVPAVIDVQVMGAPSSAPGVVFGNLLVVSYREMRAHPVQDGCAVKSPGKPCSGDLPWGAPTRIESEAVFEFLDSWPADDSGKIVLAQIELSGTCEVVRVLPGVRRYAMPVKPQQVRSLSLEGEKDIDQANPKVLYFHVDGGYPESVLLYLRARKFSSLYYTELGKHHHAIDFNSKDETRDFTHKHTASGGATTEDGNHTHAFIVDDGELKGGIDVNSTNGDLVQGQNPIKDAGVHKHSLVGLELSTELSAWTHHHRVQGDTMAQGVTDLLARSNKKALSFVKDMKIFLDGQPITNLVRQQLEAKPGQAGKWTLLGDGTNAHPFAAPDGTGEIDLLKLGIEIGLGQHKLEFRVDDADVGGNLQYNLYVS